MFDKFYKVILDTDWSPQPPLKRGAKFFKVLLEKGDLGGYENIWYVMRDF